MCQLLILVSGYKANDNKSIIIMSFNISETMRQQITRLSRATWNNDSVPIWVQLIITSKLPSLTEKM